MVKDIYLERIRKIVRSHLKGYKFQLYFFGSQAMNRSGRASDIDVAILPSSPLPPGLLSEVRQEFEESCIPHYVDLVDLSRVSPQFAQRVKQEGIRWND